MSIEATSDNSPKYMGPQMAKAQPDGLISAVSKQKKEEARDTL
jgi:hypothetical protein